MTKSSATIRPRVREMGTGVVAAYVLAFVMAGLLLWGLVYNGGIWNLLGNTRLLSPLIDGGIVALTDQDSGLLSSTGVPSLDYYINASDPVDWLLLVLAVVMLWLIWSIKALQFHGLARFAGLEGRFGDHARAFLYGHGLGRVLPFRSGDVATGAVLEGQGVPQERSGQVIYLARAFTMFEVAVFALIGLFYSGITTWLGELMWPALILLVAYLITRPSRTRAGHRAARKAGMADARSAAQAMLREPRTLLRMAALSIIAFLLLEVTAYLIAQAFTSANVILNVEFHVILMGLVGGYVATLIPVTPGGLGQWEWGMASALYVGGLGFPECMTLAFLLTAMRYLAGGAVFLGLLFGRGAETNIGRVVELGTRNPDVAPVPRALPVTTVREDRPAPAGLPAAWLPTMPSPSLLLGRATILAAVVFGVFLLDQGVNVMLDFWLLESLGYKDVFWTNFKAGGLIFVLCFAAFAAAVVVPALTLGRLSATTRKRILVLGALVGAYAGYTYLHRYQNYLLAFNGKEFGQQDPVFDKDLGFYVFDLPAIWTTLHILTALAVTSVLSCAIFAWVGRDRGDYPEGVGRFVGALGHLSRPLTLASVVFLGVMLALDTWFRRYSLLWKDNYDSSIPSGAQVLDVTGFFSTNNAIWVEAIVLLITAVAVPLRLRWARRAVTGTGSAKWQPLFTRSALLLLLLPGIGVDAAFRGAVAVRDNLEVTPNEPVVQYPFIQRHIDATNAAYGTDKIETKEFIPKGPTDPAPSADRLLNSPSFKNAPLWPGYNSWLERLIDPEYKERVLQTEDGDSTVYGPTLATFQQQEKLRPYYDFMDVDTVRYRQPGGEWGLYASSVRELPLNEPKPWLAWWGQSFVVFTHGYGLVMAPISKHDDRGEPQYASSGIPARTTQPNLKPENEAAYYAEGAGSMAYSNLEKISEHDRPTDAGRSEIRFADNVNAGVKLDSWAKRIAFGWKSRQLVDIVASDLITDDSRVHYYRTPIERLKHLAPFLYYDSDPYAVTGGKGVTWMVNGMTTAKTYPYSAPGELGDKSDRRTPLPQPTRWVNYVRDSVKATVDAYTGQVKLYKFANEPVIDTWQDVYPDLFTERAAMPEEFAEQVQYPPQLFHIQFDDLYVYYHQKDPLTFFAQEDVFDDADEVVGPVLDEGRAITFSMEPYYWMAEPGGALPASSEKSQFAMSMAFTPENALNLRAFATVYMSGKDYGKLSMLEIPKGRYYQSPEQADSAIDQDPFISQQLGLWTRRGLETIRGHTTPLIVDGELIYIEPVFIRSKQNPLPRLERVIAVYRGEAIMQETLEEAVRQSIKPQPIFPIRRGPELGGEPGFVPTGKGEPLTRAPLEGFERQVPLAGEETALPERGSE